MAHVIGAVRDPNSGKWSAEDEYINTIVGERDTAELFIQGVHDNISEILEAEGRSLPLPDDEVIDVIFCLYALYEAINSEHDQ